MQQNCVDDTDADDIDVDTDVEADLNELKVFGEFLNMKDCGSDRTKKRPFVDYSGRKEIKNHSLLCARSSIVKQIG